MNIAKMMQQAKAMQEKMQDMQTKMESVTVEGSSGGGMVKAVLTCKGQCVSITLDPSLMKPEEKEIAEDLIKAAMNDARAKGDAKMAEETQRMMGELGLPPGALGGSGLPF
jgi:DNA-binding YbaB/EbfC family protein